MKWYHILLLSYLLSGDLFASVQEEIARLTRMSPQQRLNHAQNRFVQAGTLQPLVVLDVEQHIKPDLKAKNKNFEDGLVGSIIFCGIGVAACVGSALIDSYSLPVAISGVTAMIIGGSSALFCADRSEKIEKTLSAFESSRVSHVVVFRKLSNRNVAQPIPVVQPVGDEQV